MSRPDPATKSPPPSNGDLPLRWAVILAVALGFGVLVGATAGLVPALTLGLVLVGLLHTILPKS